MVQSCVVLDLPSCVSPRRNHDFLRRSSTRALEAGRRLSKDFGGVAVQLGKDGSSREGRHLSLGELLDRRLPARAGVLVKGGGEAR